MQPFFTGPYRISGQPDTLSVKMELKIGKDILMPDYHQIPIASYVKRAGIAAIPFLLLTLMNLFLSNVLQQWDERLLLQIYNSGGPAMDHFVMYYTELAGKTTFIFILIYLFLNIRYYLKNKKLALWFALTLGIGAGLLNPILKLIIMRPRPYIISHLVGQSGFSFPSGHSIGAMVLYGTLAVLIYERYQSNKWGRFAAYFIFSFFPITIAMSRLYLGVHYPSDTIAGLSLGAAVVILATGYLRYFLLSPHHLSDPSK